MPLAPPPPAAHAAVVTQSERAIVRELNAVRRYVGVPTLHVTRRLSRSADRRTHTILRTDRLSHRHFRVQVRRSGVRSRHIGETLAWAPRGRGSGARRIVAMWMRSPAHRDTLLDRRFRRIGVGRGRGALGSRRGIAVTVNLSSRR